MFAWTSCFNRPEQKSHLQQIHAMLGFRDIAHKIGLKLLHVIQGATQNKFAIISQMLASIRFHEVRIQLICSWMLHVYSKLTFDRMNLIDTNNWDMANLFFVMAPCFTWSNLRPFLFKSELFENLTPCTKVHWPFTNCPVSWRPSIVWICRIFLF